jgi:hypothetical protein
MKRLLLLLVLFFFTTAAWADTRITLKNSFIEKYKNRATIVTTFTVDKAHKHPNSPSKDGDLHIAGRAPEVKLPIVAEIMNARLRPDAVDLVQEAETNHESLHLTGAWRIWTEHGGDSIQTQGDVPPITTTNPDHVFEVHPVTNINTLSLVETFQPIEGYEAKDADRAFHRYESTRSEITPGQNTTTIVTTMAGYNYVEFLLVLNEKPRTITDGKMALAGVYDLEGDLLVRNRRMVFVGGTPPDTAVTELEKDACLHVLGIPRISLTLVSWRAHHKEDRADALTWSLPYEIIVVGLYPDQTPCQNVTL